MDEIDNNALVIDPVNILRKHRTRRLILGNLGFYPLYL